MVSKNMVVGVAAAVMACSAAVANDIDPWCLEFVGIRGQAVEVKWDDPNPGSITFKGNAGLLKMRSLDNNGLHSAGQVFDAFCADIGVQLRDVGCYEVVYPVTWPEHQGVNPSWIEGGFDRAAWLVKNIPTSNVPAAMAGLQLAIWEALYDPDLDISAGVLRVITASAAAKTAATTYLAALGGSSQMGDAAWLVKIIPTSNVPAAMAGLQLAIWEALYDPGLNISAGVLQVISASTAAKTAATTYLAALAGSSQVGDAAWLKPVKFVDGQCVDCESQGLITKVPDGGVTLLLLGLGFSGLSLIQRRSRRA
jgi:hypothetical protein